MYRFFILLILFVATYSSSAQDVIQLKETCDSSSVGQSKKNNIDLHRTYPLSRQTVVYIDNCCQKESMDSQDVGANDFLLSSYVQPNPVVGSSNIIIESSREIEEPILFSICNEIGEEVYRKAYSPENLSEIEVNAESFVDGIYFYNISTTKENFEGQFVILK